MNANILGMILRGRPVRGSRDLETRITQEESTVCGTSKDPQQFASIRVNSRLSLLLFSVPRCLRGRFFLLIQKIFLPQLLEFI